MKQVSLFLLLLTILNISCKSLAAKDRCKICREFVESFNKRFDATRNSGYSGGDTAWEEENLGSYAHSEVRLIEIMDSTCEKTNNECFDFLADHEEDLEKWWLTLRHGEGNMDLHVWLCIQEQKLCCPDNHFGPDCELCPGGPDQVCSSHGNCEGAGNRDGSGTCVCDTGYHGDMCEDCFPGYYNDSDTCIACHVSCQLTCKEGGPGGCDSCKGGWVWKEEGCQDVNECESEDVSCGIGTFCLNTEGSYKCQACDTSCKDSCTGPGPLKCVECASGYEMSEHHFCQDVDECSKGEVECEEGTYCANKLGSYRCETCHVSCKLGCSGPGSHSCIDCADGYEMKDGTCTDLNECEFVEEGYPCNNETEKCENLQGSFKCDCKEGLVQQDGQCVKPVEKKTQTSEKKKKKKEKSKRKGGKEKINKGKQLPQNDSDSDPSDSEEEDVEKAFMGFNSEDTETKRDEL